MNRATLLLFAIIETILVFALACGTTAPKSPEVTKVTVEVTKERTCLAEPTISTTPATTAPVMLKISVDGDLLQFDIDKFEAVAGTEVAVVFDNVSKANQHNWVLVKAGTKNDVASRGSKCRDNGWVQPGDPDVIARTKLLSPGESDEIRFIAPPAGTYQIVCTFPGHNFVMFGEFVVTP